MPVACHPVRYSGFAVSDCDRPGQARCCRLEQERLLQGSLFFHAWKFVDSVQTLYGMSRDSYPSKTRSRSSLCLADAKLTLHLRLAYR